MDRTLGVSYPLALTQGSIQGALVRRVHHEQIVAELDRPDQCCSRLLIARNLGFRLHRRASCFGAPLDPAVLLRQVTPPSQSFHACPKAGRRATELLALTGF